MDLSGVGWEALAEEFRRDREIGRVRDLVEASPVPRDRFEEVVAVLAATIRDTGEGTTPPAVDDPVRPGG